MRMIVKGPDNAYGADVYFDGEEFEIHCGRWYDTNLPVNAEQLEEDWHYLYEAAQEEYFNRTDLRALFLN